MENDPPVLRSLSILKKLLAHKTVLCILGCIANIFNREVDASQVYLLKKALRLNSTYMDLLIQYNDQSFSILGLSLF